MSLIATRALDVIGVLRGDLLSGWVVALSEVVTALFSEVLTEVAILVVAFILVLLFRDVFVAKQSVTLPAEVAPDGRDKACSGKPSTCTASATTKGGCEEVEAPGGEDRSPGAEEVHGCRVPTTTLSCHEPTPVATLNCASDWRPAALPTRLCAIPEAEESPDPPRACRPRGPGLFRETRRALADAGAELAAEERRRGGVFSGTKRALREALAEFDAGLGTTGSGVTTRRRTAEWHLAASSLAKVFSVEMEDFRECEAKPIGASAWHSAASIVARVFNAEAEELDAEETEVGAQAT